MTATIERAVTTTPEPLAPWRRWAALGVLCAVQLMTAIDLLIMLVAVPSIQEALGISVENSQWIITAYALAFGGLLLLGGRIGDYNGRKMAFLVGVAGFTAASALGGAAQSAEVLFAARALQGVFAALLVPAALATISVTFTEPKERARAFAVYGAVTGSGVALGLIFGGLLTEYASWRWCLLVNVPLGLLLLVPAKLFLLDSRLPGKPRYDVLGAITVTLGITALVYGLVRAPEQGWTDPITVGCLVGSVLLILLFTTIESKVAQPLLPLHLLDRSRVGVLLANLALWAAVVGSYLFFIVYLQAVEGYSALESGLAMLPYPVGLVLTAALLEQRLGRMNPRIPLTVGPIFGVVVFGCWAFIGPDWGYTTHLVPLLAFLGVGMIVFYVATTTAVLGGSDEDDAGVVSAVLNAVQQIGAALGPAVLTTLSVEVTQRSSGDGPPTPDDVLDGYHAAFAGATGFVVLAAIFGFALVRSRPEASPAPVAVATVSHASMGNPLGSMLIRTEPEVTETVTTRVTTRRTADGSVMTVETITVTRTVVETSVTEQVIRRQEPGIRR